MESACDHLNPESWIVHDGRAFCPGCMRFMGRVVEQAAPADVHEAFKPKSELFGAKLGPVSKRGVIFGGSGNG